MPAGPDHGVALRSVSVPAERQVGGRDPAPGDLGLVQAFVNSRWDLDAGLQDKLATPESLAAWLAAHGLGGRDMRLSSADLRRTLDVREGLRALMFANNGAPPDRPAIARLNRELRAPRLSVQLDASAPPDVVAAGDDLDSALALIAAIVAVAQLDGRWDRLKACRGVDCGWAFYDHSRNLAGSWCAMSVCGARTKAREYRKRRRRGAR